MSENQTATPFATTIKAICNSTLYPDSCITALSPLDNASQPDPAQLIRVSLQAAMNELAKVTEKLDNVGTKETLDRMSLTALSDCVNLVDLAIDQLNNSIVSSVDFSSDEVVRDLKTWMSVAITYEHTCVDGFANAAVEVKGKMVELMKNSTEFTSNSLAILTEVSDFIGSINRRRLMIHDDSNHDHRKLLEGLDETRKKPDAVVAVDGSGRYKPISEAMAKSTREEREEVCDIREEGDVL